jgi:hypothetical protein
MADLHQIKVTDPPGSSQKQENGASTTGTSHTSTSYYRKTHQRLADAYPRTPRPIQSRREASPLHNPRASSERYYTEWIHERRTTTTRSANRPALASKSRCGKCAMPPMRDSRLTAHRTANPSQNEYVARYTETAPVKSIAEFAQ